ncbi:DUF3604 domain-containing protein [Ovoidimarina sediminis]
MAFEWTSLEQGNNLHRNVIFKVPIQPIAATHSSNFSAGEK